jgi:hypothetical protein
MCTVKLQKQIHISIFKTLFLDSWKAFSSFKQFADCYHLVNVISLSLTQSEHIKQLPL